MNKKNINRALFLTKVIKLPVKKIFTFWDTRFPYIIASGIGEDETVIRSGNLLCEKPAFWVPGSHEEGLHGFSKEAVEFMHSQFRTELNKLLVMGYQFKNNFESMHTVSLSLSSAIENILLQHSNGDTAIFTTPDDIWSFGLIKTSFEIMENSFAQNLLDLKERGYLKSEQQKRVDEIEILFEEAENNTIYIKELGNKLQEYGLYEEYESRFYTLIQKMKKF